jgi:hypothetical protein
VRRASSPDEIADAFARPPSGLTLSLKETDSGLPIDPLVLTEEGEILLAQLESQLNALFHGKFQNRFPVPFPELVRY